MYYILSRGSSVSTVTSLRAGRPGLDSRQGQGRDFPHLHSAQTGSGAHRSSYPMDTGGSFPEGKTEWA
jgi:hypothetical protein